jgi:hypothetical protein
MWIYLSFFSEGQYFDLYFTIDFAVQQLEERRKINEIVENIPIH